MALTLSDAIAIDANGNPLGYRLWDAIVPPFTRGERRLAQRNRLFEVLVRHYVATGATLAFRAEYRDLVLPIPSEFLHDAWIATLVAAVAPCRIIEEPLIRYRQHPNQAQGERPLGFLEQFRVARRTGRIRLKRTADMFKAIHDRLDGATRHDCSAQVLANLRGKVDHCQRRIAMLERGGFRLPTVVRGLVRGEYRRYSHWWKWPLADLFI
jgi:hypothetical protein